jgi:DNA (cytosine-5)-methyltransferase 1
MPAMAIALQVPIVIIENVREVKADHHQVVEQTIQLLSSHGYRIAQGVMSAIDLGLPQTRSRFFLIAVKPEVPGVLVGLDDLNPLVRPRRDLQWAMGDLEFREFGGIHRPASLSAENRRRIEWLFSNEQYDLPDQERPECHRNGHTYGSVYGRLAWSKVSGTITTGFLTPGRGRYIHPTQRRALTPHEAARIQGFPDSFQFAFEDGTIPCNKTLAKVIGDAVPPIMGQAAMYSALLMKQQVLNSGADVAA